MTDASEQNDTGPLGGPVVTTVNELMIHISILVLGHNLEAVAA